MKCEMAGENLGFKLCKFAKHNLDIDIMFQVFLRIYANTIKGLRPISDIPTRRYLQRVTAQTFVINSIFAIYIYIYIYIS